MPTQINRPPPPINQPPRMPLKCACDPLQNRCDGKVFDYCLSNFTCFTAVVRRPQKEEATLTMGCLGGPEHSHMTCHVGSKESVAVLCCSSGNYCNKNLSPHLSTLPSPGVQSPPVFGAYLHETLYGLVGFMFISLLGAFVFWWIAHSRSKLKSSGAWSVKGMPRSSHSPANTNGRGELKIVQIGDSTLKGLFEHSCTSGSGAGAPLLAERTVSRSIELLEMIGRGRYGQVWRGLYQDEPVAVKIFSSHAEAAWRRECNIYRTVLLRHENVLAFVAADTVSRVHSCTQLWLITRYHERGSLYDYLNSNRITKQEMLHLLSSAAAGLVHLHTTIIGTQGKPGIAHRDIKSKNILVMSDKRSCIADLGLAVIETRFETFHHDSSSSPPPPTEHHYNQCNNSLLSGCQSNDPINLRAGTKRYMSPEVLEGSLDIESFEAFKKSDIYSFGLVMWEAARRCLTEDKCDDYELPYSSVVHSDPSFEEMKLIVCSSKVRPPPAQRWAGDYTLSSLSKLMEECWCATPEARLTMLRLKKSLVKLAELERAASVASVHDRKSQACCQ